MPRQDNLSKHTLNLFEGDYGKIQEQYPDIGAAVVIRRIVRAFIEKLEASDTLPDTDVDVRI
jgi:hypothetical protein